MAASATFALKAGVWFRRGRLSLLIRWGTACPLSGRNSTYRPVQISGAGSRVGDMNAGGHRRFASVWSTRYLKLFKCGLDLGPQSADTAELSTTKWPGRPAIRNIAPRDRLIDGLRFRWAPS